MKQLRILLGAFALLALPFSAMAEGESMTAEEFEASLHYKNGAITLPGGIAKLNVPETFRYLNPEDSRRVLEDAWGNPPGLETLGMLFPADVSPLSEKSWGIIISYDEDGHISDEDAGSIDYDELLANMKDDIEASNEVRKENGYETLDLIGWAQPPHYDQATRKFYWAKELRFGTAEQNTLNYNIRILGREGVLELNAVAGMSQLDTIQHTIPDVLAFTNFTNGNRYEDFDSSTDKVAAYGLAALVAGAAAKKLGLLAIIAAFLVKGWKLILIGMAALGGGLMKLRKNKA